MKYREWRFEDESKADWPRGVWTEEPDKVQWEDPATGLPCLARRNPGLGHWCGYVGVTSDHPLHGVDYGKCPQSCGESFCGHTPESVFEVHGGITYTAFCQEDRERGVCHIPDEDEPEDVFWFGFDFAHAGDFSPGMHPLVLERGLMGLVEDYRTLEYVKSECARLAAQLVAVT